MRRRAFTLLEVLLVVVLLAVLAAFVWPDMQGFTRAARLEESADRLRGVVAMSRARAMSEAARYRVSFVRDGSVHLTRQRDPLAAPNEYVAVREPWATRPLLQDAVWVDAFQPLPQGPPPIRVEDELVEFTDFDEDPRPIVDAAEPHAIDFEPDGTSGSARWVLRDDSGRGFRMTLDGRLGRVHVEPVERLAADAVRRPPKLADGEAEEALGLGPRRSP